MQLGEGRCPTRLPSDERCGVDALGAWPHTLIRFIIPHRIRPSGQLPVAEYRRRPVTRTPAGASGTQASWLSGTGAGPYWSFFGAFPREASATTGRWTGPTASTSGCMGRTTSQVMVSRTAPRDMPNTAKWELQGLFPGAAGRRSGPGCPHDIPRRCGERAGAGMTSPATGRWEGAWERGTPQLDAVAPTVSQTRQHAR